MKILPRLINTKNVVCNEIKTTYAGFNKARLYGNEIAQRTASRYNMEDKMTLYKCICQIKQISKMVTPYNLPVLAGIAGMFIPVPGVSPALFVLGGIVGIGMAVYEKIKHFYK